MRMDNRAGEMGVFVLAAESGGFSAAGRRLGMTPSAVSKLVGRIEDRLGTPLFQRSTRGLQLTPEGELYLDRARRILADIDETERMVGQGADTAPRGRLRVSASVAFGERVLLPALPAFLARYPLVEIDLTLTDVVIDLVDQRTDIAIRVGNLRDSSLMARKLFENRRVIVASPAYLERRGVPATPRDLAGHDCLRFNFRRSQDEWPFRDPDSGKHYSLAVSGSVLGNSGVVLRQLALDGVGLARLGRYHVTDDIKAGTLIPVLEDYNAAELEEVHALFLGHQHLASRVRAFVDFLVEEVGRMS